MSKYVLTLYVAGINNRNNLIASKILDAMDTSKQAIELDVVNILDQPKQAIENDVMATPVLVKKLPLPVQKVLGNLTQEKVIIEALELKPTPHNLSS